MSLPENIEEIVSNLKKQGMSEDDIRKTLVDLGVDSSTLSRIFGDSGGKPSHEEHGDAGEILPDVKPLDVGGDEVVVKDEHVEEIHEKINALHDKITSTPTVDDVREVREALSKLEGDIKEIRAMLSALQKLLKDVLDTNRSILVELQENR